METRFYRKAFLAISPILIVPALITLLSCGLLPKDKKEKEIYTILDMALSRIKEKEKKDSIFIATGPLYPEYLVEYIHLEEIKNILTPLEIEHLKKQAEIPFKIDLQKITSNEHFFNYKKPVKRLDERGIVIGTRELYADYSRLVYSLSKPLYTLDGKYSLLFIHKRDEGAWVWVYKKQNKEWILYRGIGLYVE